MNKKKLFSILAVVLILVAGIVIYATGVLSSTTPTPNDSKDNKNTTAPVDEGKDSDAEEPIADDSKEVEKEIEEIGSVDKDKVSPMKGFSREEIKEATEFVSDYAYASHSNQYLLSGEWAKDGAKVSNFTPFMNAFYSKKVIDELDKLEGKQGSDEFAEKFTSLAPFFDETDTYRPADVCKDNPELDKDGKTVGTSEMNPYPIDCTSNLKISEITFNSIPDGEAYYLRADFSVKADLALYSKELESDAKTTADYKYSIRLEKNMLDSDKSEWEITGYSIKPSMSKIEVASQEGNDE